MAGSTPPRHGSEWDRQSPSVAEPTGGPKPPRQLGAFFEELPPEAVDFLTHSGEVKVNAQNLVVGNTIEISRIQVPTNYMFVITNVEFYGLVPSKFPYSPLVPVLKEQLVGLIRFNLLFQNRQSMRSTGDYVNPYVVVPEFKREGWPFVELSPSEVCENFSLYAKSDDKITAVAYVDVIPNFWLSILGVRFTGYALPELMVQEHIKRAANR
jgi:hypothetical protein